MSVIVVFRTACKGKILKQVFFAFLPLTLVADLQIRLRLMYVMVSSPKIQAQVMPSAMINPLPIHESQADIFLYFMMDQGKEEFRC